MKTAAAAMIGAVCMIAALEGLEAPPEAAVTRPNTGAEDTPAKPPVLLARAPTPEPTVAGERGNHCWETYHDRIQWDRILREQRYEKDRTRALFMAAESPVSAVPADARVQPVISRQTLRSIWNSYSGFPKSEGDGPLSDYERKFAYRLRTEFGIRVHGEEPVEVDEVLRGPVDLRRGLASLEGLDWARAKRMKHQIGGLKRLSLQAILEGHPYYFSCRYKIRRKKPK